MKKNPWKKTDQDRIDIATKVCDLYAIGKFTIEGCCNDIGVDYNTFWNWCQDLKEIGDLYIKAKEKHNKATKSRIREKALTALEKMMSTYHVDETEVEEAFDKKNRLTSKKVKVKKRAVTPNITGLIWALKNCDPANWNDQIQMEVSGDVQVFTIGGQTFKF